MHPSTILDRLFLSMAGNRRALRRLTPSVRPLEGRQLLSASPSVEPAASATMSQTATFPDLESLPNVATQAFLYFSAPMGTLTEVDVVTSGSYSSQFYAENLGPSNSTIEGTTSGNLSINVPTGAIPLTIPSVTETFNASAFDGALNYVGPSGTDFAPVTSSSAAQTTVLTSPADLAAFTGSFRIPITVSGHATGSATSSNGDLSSGFNTQTSATITVIYHYIPNLPSLDPPPTASPSSQPDSVPGSGTATGSSDSPTSSNTSPTSAPVTTPTGTVPATVSLLQTSSTQTHNASTHGKKKGHADAAKSTHNGALHPLAARPRQTAGGHSRGAKTHLISNT
jgi:hypothetical protein